MKAQSLPTLSHGEQRQLEIAMMLATNPVVLLLDEPLAGMGAEESARMVELLRKLAKDHAILLVEHDMDAVFAVADRLTVMVNGQVLESGSPAQIRASRAVQEAYLGSEVTDGMPEALLIEARGIHTYYGASHVLHGVDLVVHGRDRRTHGPQRHGQDHADPEHARSVAAARRQRCGCAARA